MERFDEIGGTQIDLPAMDTRKWQEFGMVASCAVVCLQVLWIWNDYMRSNLDLTMLELRIHICIDLQV